VNLTTAAEFLRAGASALGIGSELISRSELEAGNGSAISEIARRYVRIVDEVRNSSRAVA
jgi:2-dehydro-3-deoxyphosphogluconate aldolase/(4S)-4-hydroxy-2-oxoglutarate aldolase